jgi:hypothetical protein
MPEHEDLPIFVKWVDFLKWLLLTTEKFPKKARFTFSDRINRLALDLLDDLIEARYSRQKTVALKRANLSLEKIRVLLRISFEIRLLPFKAYEHSMVSINEVGRMLGGWLKQQEAGK